MRGSTRSATPFASIFFKLVRLYTYNTPIRKGSSRLMLLALKLVSERPKGLTAPARDGRQFAIDFSTGMQERVFFFGEYEPFITELVDYLVDEGDVCIDAGANFGWYTTLLARKIGPTGQVHAFEPVPSTYEELVENTDLMPDDPPVFLNDLALSDAESEAVITVFSNEPTGHASLAAKGKEGRQVRCETIRLDTYLSDRNIKHVNFVKVDVEGAELSFLRGADSIFQQAVPPLIVMEMALATALPFGYRPNDLIEFIRSKAEYVFYKIDEVKKRLIPINGFTVNDMGANVLCVPTNAEERIQPIIRDYQI